MKRVGVFVCWCGLNIGGVVDVPRVVEKIAAYPGVVAAREYRYMCSDPGQALLAQTIKEYQLDAVVVAACSPAMHESTFRRAAEEAGVNPYRVEIANIREQCSWVHDDEPEAATSKALSIIQSMVEKARGDDALKPIEFGVEKKALVIGGGISGMQAALEIANAGYPVILVEKEPCIGGRMAQLLDCASCILTPRTVEVGRHPDIQLLAYSQVESVEGNVGNFTVKIRRKAAYVDWDKCTGCGECTTKCPVKVPAEFERGLGERRAIYVTFPQAVPYRPVIDADNCWKLTRDKCGVCARICPVGAVDYEMKDQIIEEQVGAIVLATGYSTLPKEELAEYGYGKIPDVIDGLQFERLNSASGPTAGEVRRPSDGKIPKEVVFIQCAGSRDQEKHKPYCSKICCMYTAKHARLFKHKVHDGQAYIFYMDIRAGGKGYEEFVQRAVEDDGALYLRGRVSRVFQDGDKVMVWGVDTLSGKRVEIAADLVVLATAIVPRPEAKELAQALKVGTDEHGFMSEVHPKLRPVESITQGIFLTGACQAPKDIPDSVSQAGAAASKVLSLFARDQLEHDPTVVRVDEDLCAGCGVCVQACPYDARVLHETSGVAEVLQVLCQGCGACATACPNGATQLINTTKGQVINMIDSLLD